MQWSFAYITTLNYISDLNANKMFSNSAASLDR